MCRSTGRAPSLCTRRRWPTRAPCPTSGTRGRTSRCCTATRTPSGRCSASRGEPPARARAPSLSPAPDPQRQVGPAKLTLPVVPALPILVVPQVGGGELQPHAGAERVGLGAHRRGRLAAGGQTPARRHVGARGGQRGGGSGRGRGRRGAGHQRQGLCVGGPDPAGAVAAQGGPGRGRQAAARGAQPRGDGGGRGGRRRGGGGAARGGGAGGWGGGGRRRCLGRWRGRRRGARRRRRRSARWRGSSAERSLREAGFALVHPGAPLQISRVASRRAQRTDE